MLKVACVLLVFVLTGCSGVVGSKIAKSVYLDDLSSYKNEAEIVKKYEAPTFSWIDRNGNRVSSYYLIKSRQSFFAYIPIAYYFSSVNSDNYEVNFVYGVDGAVLSVNKFYSKVTSKNDGVCSYYSDLDGCIYQVDHMNKDGD